MVELKNVIVEEHYALTFDALFRLIHGETVALRINSFVNDSLCNKWQEKMTNSAQFSRYANASEFGISKLGKSLFEIENQHSPIQNSNKFERQLEDIFDPYPNPLQMLQLGLDSLWPDGAKPLNIGGKTVCPGILSYAKKGNEKSVSPQKATFKNDIKQVNKNINIKTQLAAKLYIRVPETGGELEIWPVTLDSNAIDFMGQNDFIERHNLNEPIIIKPRQGELVLFRSDCLHAVRSGFNSDSISASCFVGYSGEFDPLKYWA